MSLNLPQVSLVPVQKTQREELEVVGPYMACPMKVMNAMVMVMVTFMVTLIITLMVTLMLMKLT